MQKIRVDSCYSWTKKFVLISGTHLGDTDHGGISATRACANLIALRFRRLINISIRGSSRSTSDSKRKAQLLLALIIAPLVFYQAHILAHHSITGAIRAFGPAHLPAFIAAVLLILFIALVAEGVSLKNKDLARLDWDLEWLLTLPVSLAVLQLMKVIEQTILNVFGWTTIFPLLTAYCWHMGLRWSAPILGFILSLNILLLLGVTRVVVETAIRRYGPQFILRNFQAFCTLLAVAAIALAMAPALAASNEAKELTHPFIWNWYGKIGSWPLYLPTGASARLISMLPSNPAQWLQGLSLLILTTLILFFCEWLLLRFMVRDGVIESGGSMRGRRVSASSQAPLRVRHRLSSAIAGIVGKDLHLLWRDRNMLIGTLIVPIVLLGMQLAFNPAVLRQGFFDYRHIAAMAFGVAAYVLMFSAFSVITAEGPALWLLYCAPRQLHRLLLEKILLWATFAALYAIALLTYGWLRLPFSWLFVSLSTYVLLATILCALIAGALGVFGANPLDPDPPRRASPMQLYTFLLLAAAIGAGGIYAAPGNWYRAVILIIVAFLAYALWEKVRERLPYLLDPVAKPPSRISLSDGLAAALLFFTLQIIYLFFVLKRYGITPTGPWIAAGFTISGILSISLILAARFRSRAIHLRHDLALTLGHGPRSIVRTLAITCAIALPFGILYLYLLGNWPWLHNLTRTSLQNEPNLLTRTWGLALATLAAPVVEELIFRSLIFRPLRRTHSLVISILASALLFAIIHDPLSIPPVFLLGCLCAYALEKSNSILTPILLHSLYNLTIFLAQPLAL
jgi:membrane protease YdiL (CAAX protease family)